MPKPETDLYIVFAYLYVIDSWLLFPSTFSLPSLEMTFSWAHGPFWWHFPFCLVAGYGHVTLFSSMKCKKVHCGHFPHYLLKRKLLALDCLFFFFFYSCHLEHRHGRAWWLAEQQDGRKPGAFLESCLPTQRL